MTTKFFNRLVPGEGRCTIYLYGEIGESGPVNSADVVLDLADAVREYGRVDIRINSIGGDVYSGIAIFNAITQSKADIHIYIDGIAASMASAIALCGRHVEMSRHARLMIHSVRGGFYGTAAEMESCAREILSLEDTLAGMYAKRAGLTHEEFKAAYFDGRDHWMTAAEALEKEFVDGIYDTDPVPEDSTPEQIYQTFNNRLEEADNLNKSNMALIDEIKKNPQFKDCTTDQEVLARLGQLEGQANGAAALATENATLKQENQDFKAREAAAFEARKKELLDGAVRDGRISEATRPAFEALLEQDFEKGKSTIEALKPAKRVMDDIGVVQQGGKDHWTEAFNGIKARYDSVNK
ncbi:MAG: Clp protease ClpP [Bacteroidales bacterium]|nr:Clp protease ClpP [Bacteroidales bacterium]